MRPLTRPREAHATTESKGSREAEQEKSAFARNGILSSLALSTALLLLLHLRPSLSFSLLTSTLSVLTHTKKTSNADASIWVHQFVKAMRDSQGEPLPNAHLLGFFRRACR